MRKHRLLAVLIGVAVGFASATVFAEEEGASSSDLAAAAQNPREPYQPAFSEQPQHRRWAAEETARSLNWVVRVRQRSVECVENVCEYPDSVGR